MIRPALAADAERIAALHIASWRAAYREELPAAYLAGQDLGVRTAMWLDHIGDGRTTVLVEDREGEIVGFCAFGPSRDADANPDETWAIHNIHVSSELRRSGIGQLLFEAALDRARANAASVLT